jgi:hypothetical protein
MLIRMLYVSTAVGPTTTAVTGTILRSAQAFNVDNGITGVLCQGQGVWLQVLEGPRSEVNALYGRILADKRHKNVQLIAVEDITHRRYGAWAMAHVNLSGVDPVLAQNTSGAAFDPYSATGEGVMAHIDALIAAGKVMGAPVV